MRTKNEQRPQEIIDVVAHMVIEEGISSIAMGKVAKRTGISQSNIYLYFKNKDDLLKQVFLAQKTKINNYMYDHFNEQPNVIDDMKLYARIVYQFAMEYPVAMDVITQYENSPIFTQIDISAEEAEMDFDRVTVLVKQGMKDGIIRDTDPYVLMAIAFDTLVRYAKSVRDKIVDPIQVPLETILDILEAAWLAPKE
ncbi:TetR/AcrR family transcriptional regulator [Furfurilactobacillus milii]|uniref:TetR/AcrR family transcriptional regulator n=1 Tax=Furfurilactobacillus milii TaxID=2888272 RepID=UPI001F237D3B|nr:TetR/AcrR family transcriptional regulator [Furfurilactobacillus milii]MCF6418586.1 TetR/AcrR family transcriptional regulator [Furfurilactobacillus milii]